jgi:hypothetical protein
MADDDNKRLIVRYFETVDRGDQERTLRGSRRAAFAKCGSTGTLYSPWPINCEARRNAEWQRVAAEEAEYSSSGRRR